MLRSAAGTAVNGTYVGNNVFEPCVLLDKFLHPITCKGAYVFFAIVNHGIYMEAVVSRGL
jgi:hypothetical protein